MAKQRPTRAELIAALEHAQRDARYWKDMVQTARRERGDAVDKRVLEDITYRITHWEEAPGIVRVRAYVELCQATLTDKADIKPATDDLVLDFHSKVKRLTNGR